VVRSPGTVNKSLIVGAAVARVVTEALAPAVLVVVLLMVVGGWWGVLAALFSAVIPFAYILLGVRRGRLTDHHIALREQRHIPLAFGVASVLVGLLLLWVLRAPRDLLALVVAGAVGLGVCAAVTGWWKMSIHTAVAAGTAVILALVLGPVWWASTAVVALIGWARVRLSAHTVGQVLAGAAIGAAIAGTVFPVLR
jgi:hypothetical protein